jgi:hypothetical protein
MTTKLIIVIALCVFIVGGIIFLQVRKHRRK